MDTQIGQQLIQTLGEVKGTQQAILTSIERVCIRLDRFEDRVAKIEDEHSAFKEKTKNEIQDIKITQGKYGLAVTLVATGISLGFSKLLDIFMKGH